MKILLADDGSDHARLATALIPRVAGFRDADVTVASVVSGPRAPAVVTPPGIGAAVPPVTAISVVEKLQQHAQNVVQDSANALSNAGVKTEARLLSGDPATELLSLAESENYDLVISGSRGLGSVVAMLMGSVARKLVTHAKTSVLIAHPYKDTKLAESLARLEAKSKLDALLAVDDSSVAHQAVQFLGEMSSKSFAKLTVLTIDPMMALPPTLDPAFAAGMIPADEKNALRVAEEHAKELTDAADEVVARGEVGRPSSTISDVAQQIQADLVVIGAQRHGAIERFLLGSTSYEVATTAPCSVLVVRDS